MMQVRAFCIEPPFLLFKRHTTKIRTHTHTHTLSLSLSFDKQGRTHKVFHSSFPCCIFLFFVFFLFTKTTKEQGKNAWNPTTHMTCAHTTPTNKTQTPCFFPAKSARIHFPHASPLSCASCSRLCTVTPPHSCRLHPPLACQRKAVREVVSSRAPTMQAINLPFITHTFIHNARIC